MSLVFENALMPSEDQQALRLRLVYFMRRFLLIALGASLLIPTVAKAERDEVRHLCASLQVGDFIGAIKDLSNAININENPLIQESYLLRGANKYESTDFSGAILDFDKVIASDQSKKPYCRLCHH